MASETKSLHDIKEDDMEIKHPHDSTDSTEPDEFLKDTDEDILLNPISDHTISKPVSFELNISKIQKHFSVLRNVSLCAKRTKWYNPYYHYYILVAKTDMTKFWYVGFDREGKSFQVRLHNFAKKPSIIATKEMGPEFCDRLSIVLGMTNYNLKYRNCEHVARFLFDGIWYCSQMNRLYKIFGSSSFEERLVDMYPLESKQEYNEMKTSSSLNFVRKTRFRSEIPGNQKNIIFFGPCGAGKSNLINHLSKAECCQSQRSPDSVTQVVEFIECKGQNRTFNLIDTIGVDHSHDWNMIFNLVKDRIGNKKILVHQAWLLIKISERINEDTRTRLKEFNQWIRTKKNVSEYRIVMTHSSHAYKREEQVRLKDEMIKVLQLLGINTTVFTMVDLNDSTQDKHLRDPAKVLSQRILGWINQLDIENDEPIVNQEIEDDLPIDRD